MSKISRKKRIILILMFLIILGFLINFSKSYAASASISPKNKTVKVGEPVKVTGTINAASGEISLTGANKIAWNSDDASNITKTISTTFTPQEEGTTKIILSGKIWDENSKGTQTKDSISVYQECVITAKGNSSDSSSSTSKSTSDSKEVEKNLPTESTKKTTDTSNKSRNNYLSSIKISDGTLSPEFNRETTEYTINFDDENTIKNLDKIKITATAEDKKSKVTGTGEKALTEGDNKFSITVTSESGDTRTYVINVTKPVALKESDLKLSSLKVQTVDIDGNYSDANLENTFDSNVYEYTLNVESNISSLNIDAVPENENIDVSITGNEALHEGMNEVIITLTSKDDNTIQTTYKIVVNKAQSELLINASDNESLQNDNFARKNRKFIFTIGILTIILIALLIIWYKKSKKRLNNNEKIEKNLNHNLIDDDDIIIDKDNEEYNEIKQKNVDDANVKNDTKEFDEKFNVSTKPKRKGGKHF